MLRALTGRLLMRRWYSVMPEKERTSCWPNTGGSSTPTGLVLGVHSEPGDSLGQSLSLTSSASKYDEVVKGKLSSLLKAVSPPPSLPQVRTFYGLDDTFSAVAVVGLGRECAGYDPVEEIDEQKERIRRAAGAGCQVLQELNVQRIYVESFGHSESAAEGAAMAVWLYQSNRSECERVQIPKMELFDSADWIGWKIGLEKASAQNLARQLMETPPNQLTPTVFALSVQEVLAKASVDVNVRTKKWAQHRNLKTFLAVSSGSCQQPIFLEVSYEGCDPDVAPIILVGKGVTFDAGGLCLKGCRQMQEAGRGEMSGAAAVVSAVRAIASLQIPINARGLIPLCENLPGASAFKPGDVIMSYNGKSILVDDTNSDGQLILADALSYSKTYRPRLVLDVGSLTEDIGEVLGSSASAAFTASDQLFNLVRIASIHTGDRVVRLPLWDYYSKGVSDSQKSDYTSVGREESGRTCKAASFLQRFAPRDTDWLHLDTGGVWHSTGGEPTGYLRPGMSGRPVRTLVEFLSQLACQDQQAS